MDVSLIPLYIFKIPANCNDILVTANLMYTVQCIKDSHLEEEYPLHDNPPLLTNPPGINPDLQPDIEFQLDSNNLIVSENKETLQRNDCPVDEKKIATEHENSVKYIVGVVGSNTAELRIGEDSVSTF